MNPFDIVEDISSTKKGIIDASNEKAYNSYMVNKAFSYFPDTLSYAQDMNINHHLDNKIQYDYMFNVIRKRKRYSKWSKPKKDQDIEMICLRYNYNKEKAKAALSILTDVQLKKIRQSMEKGG